MFFNFEEAVVSSPSRLRPPLRRDLFASCLREYFENLNTLVVFFS